MVKIDQPVEVESGNKVLDYPLDKDFSMVVEGTQMKEGSDLASLGEVEMDLVEGGTKDLVDQAEVDG
jgi:hypothetical protein